jgi:WD40 repeat protein
VLSDAWDSVARLWSPPLGHARLEIPGINPLAVASDGRSFGFGHRYGLLPTTAIPAGILRLDGAEECRWLYDPWSSGTWEGEPHVSPDERLLATEGSEGLRLWALPAAKPIALLRIGHTRGSYFGPDSRWLITSGQRGVWRWPLARSDDLLKIGPPECLYEHPAAGRTCLSADGRVLVMRSGDQDRALVVYLDGSRPVGTFGPLARGVGFIVSPDGRQIVTCAADGATVWDTLAGEPIARVPQSTTHPWFQFSPDGEKLLSVLSREIAILDTRTWEIVCRHTWTDGQPRIPGTPEGVLAASGALGIVRLIDPRRLDVVADVPAPTPTSWARFVPRQRWLPLDVEDGDRLMLWDLSRVRAGLAKVGLDWDAPSYPPLPPNADSPTEVQIELGELVVPDR